MPIAITDTLIRGTNDAAEFPLAQESGLKLSRVMVADTTARDIIPEWKRLPFMIAELVSGEVYQLGSDTTIAGQSWTDVTPGTIPANVVTEDEIFDVDGYIQADLIRNIFLNEQFVVDSEAEMLALTTVTGNFVIRTDTSAIFVKLNNDDPATLADFSEITYPGAVLSVNGDTGAVVITLAGLITAETSVFNDAVAASPSVTTINSTLLTLTNDLDTLEATVDALVLSSGTIGGSTGTLDNAVLRADGTGGTALQSSALVVFDDGSMRMGIAGVTTGSIRIIEARGSEADVGIVMLAQGLGDINIGTNGNLSFGGDQVNFQANVVQLSNLSTATEIHIFEDTPGANYIGITVPNSISANVVYTLPIAPTTNGQVLTGNTDGTMSWSTNGVGDVVGPSSAVDNAVARFDTTTGKLIQSSAVVISDTGDIDLGIDTVTTGATRTIEVKGSASNITMVLRAKGAGGFLLQGSTVALEGTAAVSLTSVYSEVVSTAAVGGQLRFQEATVNGANYVALKSPDSLSVTTTYTLPATDGTAGQSLKTDGSGNLYWG